VMRSLHRLSAKSPHNTFGARSARKRHMHRRKQHHLGHLVGAGDDQTDGDCPAER